MLKTSANPVPSRSRQNRTQTQMIVFLGVSSLAKFSFPELANGTSFAGLLPGYAMNVPTFRGEEN
jgi:hypothetical protein